MSTNDLAARPANDIISQITSPQMLARIRTAMPEYLSPDRQVNLICQAIRKNSELSKCNPLTVINSLMEASALGLEPNSPLHHCAIIPYKGVAQLQIEFRGLIQLAMRSGTIAKFWAECVYGNDVFVYEMGAQPKLLHKPFIPLDLKADRGPIIATYACCLTKGETDPAFVVLNEQDIAHIRKSAKTQNVWDEHPAEMRKKSAIKRLSKVLNLSPQFMQAAALDDELEIGDHQTFSAAGVIDVPEYTAAAEQAHDEDKLARARERATQAKGKAQQSNGAAKAPEESRPEVGESGESTVGSPSDEPPPADVPPAQEVALQDIRNLDNKAIFSTRGRIHNVQTRTAKTRTGEGQQFFVSVFDGPVSETFSMFGSAPEWATPNAPVIIEEAVVAIVGTRRFYNLKSWRRADE